MMNFWHMITAVLLFLLMGCTAKDSDLLLYKKISTPNQDGRVKYIVLHYTAADFKTTIDIFNNDSSIITNVSSHYVIPESGDRSYHFEKIKTFQLVENDKRAWHAGVSAWKKAININDQSIGIELVNRARCQNIDGKNYCYTPDFDPQQIHQLILTLDYLMRKYPHIQPTNIVGHSDIAPERKIDPGPRFPWELLYQRGHGAWFDYKTMVRYAEKFIKEMPGIVTMQHALKKYGYHIEVTGELDQQTHQVVAAFQRHFIQDSVTGIIDVRTSAVLFALLEKYYPDWTVPQSETHDSLTEIALPVS